MSRESNVIHIGRKPPMSYVLGIMTGFAGSNSEEIILKARGRAITTAVDAAEIARRRFMKELNIGKITIGTEEIPARRRRNEECFNDRNHVNACSPRKERGGARKDRVYNPPTSYRAD